MWGREDLSPWFPVQSQKKPIGEAWFTFEENLTSEGKPLRDLLTDAPEILGTAADAQNPGICPLLVKLLFTSERLSVQVHPDDEYAKRHHESLGKTEAWYVLEAEPDAKIAAGFRKPITRERLQAASLSGEIDEILDWRNVQGGDTIFVPAGTVHAIGSGLTICEIQENSDLTYRLYDYGRPRELHLEHGAAVARLWPQEFDTKPIALTGWRDQLLECPYFRIERLRPERPIQIGSGLPYYLLLLCVRGSGRIAAQPFTAGQAWMIPAGSAAVDIESGGGGSEWILTYKPDTTLPCVSE